MKSQKALKEVYVKGSKLLEEAFKGKAKRVPVTAQIHEYVLQDVMKKKGITPKVFYNSPEMLVRETLKIENGFGLIPIVGCDVYNAEAEALGAEIIWSDKAISPSSQLEPLIHGEDTKELESRLDELISNLDFEKKEGRCQKIIQMSKEYQKVSGLGPTLHFCAPWSLAANLRGFENLIMDVFSKPDFVHHLLERLTNEVIAPWIKYQKDHFPNAKKIEGSDAHGSLPNVNDSMLLEYVVPYLSQLRKKWPEVYVSNWIGERILAKPNPRKILKNPEEMLEQKLKVCHYLEGQDPDVAELGPELYVDYAKKKGVPVVLGIGAVFLNSSTPKQIKERTLKYIKAGMAYKKFSLHLCSVTATTPKKNVKAVMDVVKKYGVY